jgi:hypothetical protein
VHAYSALRRWTNAGILGVLLTDGDEDEPTPMQKKKCQEIKLKQNEDGYPVLPSLEQINEHDLLYKKKLIDTFIGDVYSL